MDRPPFLTDTDDTFFPALVGGFSCELTGGGTARLISSVTDPGPLNLATAITWAHSLSLMKASHWHRRFATTTSFSIPYFTNAESTPSVTAQSFAVASKDCTVAAPYTSDSWLPENMEVQSSSSSSGCLQK
mgnify:CR=1 FL=1